MIGKRVKMAAAAFVILAAGVCYLNTAGNGSVKRLEKQPVTGSRAAQSAKSGTEASSEERSDGLDGFETGASLSGDAAKDVPSGMGMTSGGNASSGKDAASDKESASGGMKNQPVGADTAAAERMWIHVCGAVRDPGVYELPVGSRVYQAVEAAGGFTEEAQQDYLNMAQELADGMKVEIPDQETARRLKEQNVVPQLLTPDHSGSGAPGAGGASGGQAGTGSARAKVNINTASKEELMTLRGVGGSRAEDIITYRQERGPFKKIEDIMKVSGIKEAMFEKIKDSITV